MIDIILATILASIAFTSYVAAGYVVYKFK